MKLAELTIGQTVFHPFYGKGIIHGVYDSGVSISFEGRAASIFWDDRFASAAPVKPMHLISHLYPHPVTVIATEELERLNELVSAQDDLIDLLERGYLSNQRARDLRDLKVKINQLQSKTEK